MKKVHFVPLSAIYNDETLNAFQDILRAHTPDFACANVFLSLNYLGFDIGPRSKHLKWKQQILKFKARLLQIIGYHQVASASFQDSVSPWSVCMHARTLARLLF